MGEALWPFPFMSVRVLVCIANIVGEDAQGKTIVIKPILSVDVFRC